MKKLLAALFFVALFAALAAWRHKPDKKEHPNQVFAIYLANLHRSESPEIFFDRPDAPIAIVVSGESFYDTSVELRISSENLAELKLTGKKIPRGKRGVFLFSPSHAGTYVATAYADGLAKMKTTFWVRPRNSFR